MAFMTILDHNHGSTRITTEKERARAVVVRGVAE
jgi:hypothetical protein